MWAQIFMFETKASRHGEELETWLVRLERRGLRVKKASPSAPSLEWRTKVKVYPLPVKRVICSSFSTHRIHRCYISGTSRSVPLAGRNWVNSTVSWRAQQVPPEHNDSALVRRGIGFNPNSAGFLFSPIDIIFVNGGNGQQRSAVAVCAGNGLD